MTYPTPPSTHCPQCRHGWQLHTEYDGCLVRSCGCWRSQRPTLADSLTVTPPKETK